MSLYERVGGEEFFVRLVDRFYDGVAMEDRKSTRLNSSHRT